MDTLGTSLALCFLLLSLSLSFFFFFNFYFLVTPCSLQDLVPGPGVEPGPQ